MLYFVNNKIMISNLTSKFLLFSLGGIFLCFVDIIKTDRLRIWPLPGWGGRLATAPQCAPARHHCPRWQPRGAEEETSQAKEGGQARRPARAHTRRPPLLQGGEPSLSTAPPHVRRRERSVRSAVVRVRHSGSSPQNWPCGPVRVLGGTSSPLCASLPSSEKQGCYALARALFLSWRRSPLKI